MWKYGLVLIPTVFFVPTDILNTELKYTIESESEVYLLGSSNVHNFTCYCKEDFSNEVFTYSIRKKGSVITFENATLNLETQSLDCKNKRMNQDMYQTLKVDQFPYINIELKEVLQKGSSLASTSKNWVQYNAWVDVTVAGVTKPKLLEVNAKPLGNGKYRFVSSAYLALSDFNLDQPVALMGLIKVKNDIGIYFDIVVQTR